VPRTLMPLKVKICGITSLADARYAAAAGADMLGFIQYAPSPRNIAAQNVRNIVEWIHGPKSVGVFVNETSEVVNHTAATVGFDYVQLHGNESPGYCAQMERPVIKAFSVKPDTQPEQLRRRMISYSAVVQHFLLDTYHSLLRGGTGQTFRWQVAAELTAEFSIILAGGLGPNNVLSAIQATDPMGIDCSSQLEYTPGQKDFDKINDLFQAIDHLRS